MEFKVYGYRGKRILVFPAQDGRFFDFENFGMTDTVRGYLEQGKLQIITVDSIDQETYSAEHGDNRRRSYLLEQYYYYIVDELIPYLGEVTDNTQIYTSGVSLGAGHAANLFFRRPDIFQGTIALSGYYDSDLFFGDYVDDYIYNNSPIKYLGGMSYDHPYLELYNHRDIILCCGQGAWEDQMTYSTQKIQEILECRGVNCWIDYWGYDVNHDWDWWQKQFPYFVGGIV